MKNILAENMLRFGSKNLSVASREKLQKLAEQTQVAAPTTDEVKTPTRMNVSTLKTSLTDKATAGPVEIQSPYNIKGDIITFPSDANNDIGDTAIFAGDGIIQQLTPDLFLACGNFGKLDNTGKVVKDRKAVLKLFKFQPIAIQHDMTTGTISGMPNKAPGKDVRTLLSLKPYAGALNLAAIAYEVNPNAQPAETFKLIAPALTEFAKAAAVYGFTLTGTPDEVIARYTKPVGDVVRTGKHKDLGIQF